jgi:hypothetical protein
MFGGAMRQSGILAAAGLYALEHNVSLLAEDHANARLLAERLAGLRGVSLDLATVQSNIMPAPLRRRHLKYRRGPPTGSKHSPQTGLKQRFGESRVDLMAYGRTPWS